MDVLLCTDKSSGDNVLHFVPGCNRYILPSHKKQLDDEYSGRTYIRFNQFNDYKKSKSKCWAAEYAPFEYTYNPKDNGRYTNFVEEQTCGLIDVDTKDKCTFKVKDDNDFGYLHFFSITHCTDFTLQFIKFVIVIAQLHVPYQCRNVLTHFETHKNFNSDIVNLLRICTLMDKHCEFSPWVFENKRVQVRFFPIGMVTFQIKKVIGNSCDYKACNSKAKFRCEQCWYRKYCSKRCQKKDWKQGHRIYCASLFDVMKRCVGFPCKDGMKKKL